MFLVTVLVQNIAPKRQKLFSDIMAASGIAQKYNCALKRLPPALPKSITAR